MKKEYYDDYYRAQSRQWKDEHRRPCAAGCGTMVRHDSRSGICKDCRHSPEPEHGTRARYDRGCLCAECTYANTLHAKMRRLGISTRGMYREKVGPPPPK